MRVALADHVIDTTKANVPQAVNPKDRHVVGAALAGEAEFVVTDDGTLRTEITAARIAVESLDGDAFAMRLWTAAPDGVDETIATSSPSAGGGRIGAGDGGPAGPHFPA
jgi:hypothetical protein